MSPYSKQNIFAEKNNQPNSYTEPTFQTEPNNIIPVYNLSFTSTGSGPDSTMPYNPLTNYTSSRPDFLRYNPNRKKEIFSSIDQGMKLNDEEGIEKKTSCLKRTFKIIILFTCLVFSVHLIGSISSQDGFEFGSTGIRVNKIGDNLLSEIFGLSYTCLNRNQIDFTCGIEEREYYEENKPIIEIIPIDLTGFASMENASLTSSELVVEEKEMVEMFIDFGLLAQENIEEESSLYNPSNSQLEEIHELEEDEILSNKPVKLKTQVYLLYSMQAIACFSVLIAFVSSLHKYITKKLRKNRKRVNAITSSENEEKKNIMDLDLLNKVVNEKESEEIIEKKKECSGFLPPQVELLAEFSFGDINKENSSFVKGLRGIGVQSTYNSPVSNQRNKIPFEATKENVPIEFYNSLSKMQKKEEIKERKGIQKTEEMTPLRRSSRLRTKITSP